MKGCVSEGCFQESFKGVSRKIKGCIKGVLSKFQGFLKEVDGEFRGSFKCILKAYVSRIFQGSFQSVLKWFQWSFKEVCRVFHKGLNIILLPIVVTGVTIYKC